MNTAIKPMYEWNQIPWHKLERRVFKLQKRIYQASARGDVKTVRKLQRLLMKSWSAKCMAVRRVTQENQGKKTAGVDGLKSLTPKARLILVSSLKLGNKAAPTRRVWIPKPGTQEKRPLGIPTIYDRASQALVKLALEPEWEAKFEPNSYGFRPGRSCHDAIGAIFSSIRYKPKYVLDADIAKCFDRINQEALLNKLNTFPTIRRQIRAWLKAGVMNGKSLFPTSEGTPQGGVLSPLLANIALHGMENRIEQAFPKKQPVREGKRITIPSPTLIRYADDFVILHEDITVVQRCQQIISDWLSDIGLELKPSKTRITHTLHRYEDNVGFNFLGFSVRQFPKGKHTSGKLMGESLGFKTLITPSKEKVKEHLDQIGEVIDRHKAAPQEALIRKLNPVIRGWCNYYSAVVSKAIFSKLNHLVYQQLRAWVNRRHPNKSWKWKVDKYWQTIGKDNWVFAPRQKTMQLLSHSETPIVRHVKVQGNRSPYDGDTVYWSTRLGKYPELTKRVAMLLKQQKGKCAHCGLHFNSESLMEVHHTDKNHKNNKWDNLSLLHRHCHDIIHSTDNKELEIWLDENPF